MIRTAIRFAAALSVALPAIVSAGEPVTIAHKGVQYSYTVTETAKGRVITGKSSAGAPFRLAVSKFTVQGTFGDQPVRFKLSDVKPVKGIVEVASR